MPVYKVTRWETSSQTAYIEADSLDSAEQAAYYVEDWTENLDMVKEHEAELANRSDYKPAAVYKV